MNGNGNKCNYIFALPKAHPLLLFFKDKWAIGQRSPTKQENSLETIRNIKLAPKKRLEMKKHLFFI